MNYIYFELDKNSKQFKTLTIGEYTIDLRIDNRTDIYIDGRSTSYIDDLDEDDYVRITMRNGYVDKIEVDRRGNRWGYSSYSDSTGEVVEMSSSYSDINFSFLTSTVVFLNTPSLSAPKSNSKKFSISFIFDTDFSAVLLKFIDCNLPL